MATKAMLSKLLAIRSNLSSSLVKIAVFTEKIEVASIEAIEIRLAKLDQLWEKFYASQEDMYELAEEKGYVDPEPEFGEFESRHMLVKSVLLAAMRERKKFEAEAIQQKAALEAPPSNSPSRDSPHSATVGQNEGLDRQTTSDQPLTQPQLTVPYQSFQYNETLPKLHIEPFCGEYQKWPAFRDMFESMVHSKPNISAIRKFHLLRSSLRDKPLDMLNHIPICDATYLQAWERLAKRYDRPRFIVNSLLETFMQLPSIQSTNTKVLRKISDCADEVLRGLDSFNFTKRDPWMIYILLGKIDVETRQEWSKESFDSEDPSIKDFLEFLERRCEALESCRGYIREPTKGKSASLKSMVVSSPSQCPKCSASHFLSQCSDFIAMDVESRREFVKSKKVCFNCLQENHNSFRCKSKARCKTCNSRHHVLVHRDNIVFSSPPSSDNQSGTSSTIATNVVTNHSVNMARYLPQTLLPTAIGKVLDRNGKYQLIRILIDSGSQVSLVTESCVKRLGIRRSNARIPISGIGSTCAGRSRGVVSLGIASCYDTSSISLDAFIITNVTSPLPTISFDMKNWTHISNLQLADPSFNQSSSVDLLLGADKVWEVLQGDVVKGVNGRPVAQKTLFGWVLAGQISTEVDHSVRTHHILVDIDATLQRFWTVEELDPKSIVSKEDKAIEEHFIKTHGRDHFGKYIVKLPFKNTPKFSETIGGAVSRLKAMERKFAKDDSLLESYSLFMEEYLSLGHMRRVPSSEILKANVFYLPHHAVLKPDSITTKLRVVFDGSFKDTNGVSLNDSLMIGPPIQRNLFSVCLRFRRHKFVFTADIVKMFRQIWLADEDMDYQRIVWRKSSSDPIEHFRLATVTYGTASAPYLSVRVLEQLAYDYREECPIASEILLNDFYVDDVVTGGDSLSETILRKQCLIDLLSKGGLELSKWQSNCTDLLSENNSVQNENISLNKDPNWVKVLGLNWNSKLDCFSFRLNLAQNIESPTKRQILSDVARIFDPLGFLSPSVIELKILLQELWHQKLDWDDRLPDSIANRWRKCREELHLLTEINIPRTIGNIDSQFQLHGFSDASSSAYGAVIYSRYVLPNGEIKTNIVSAKTRVAPIKQLSIPRLELCGALLLTRLLVAVQNSLKMTFSNVFAWCDSQVVLSWLSSPSRRWDIFVGNRTSEILNTIPRNRWFHVKSEQNPADCASRGIAPSNLLNHPIWWNGPNWLSKSENNWPVIKTFEEHPDCKHEEKKQSQRSLVIVNNRQHHIEFFSSRISSWFRLIRVVAFMNRFVLKCIMKRSNAYSYHLTASEIFRAKRDIIRWVQNAHFGEDIAYFKKHGHFSKNCKIVNLNPFLDDDQILRVGGRLQQSNISFNAKHPIIIPKGYEVTKLIAEDAHERHHHTGVSTLFTILRQEYWIIGCRNLLRKITHKCNACFRQRKLLTTQIMGNLPAQRIQPSRPFTHCGCDYAGPISIKTKIGKKTQITKGYISLFVCLATKAIHLELVSDLTTEAFLAALRRFISRRGKPSHMYSDNGTNFRGSARELTEMHQHTLSEKHNSIVAESLARDAITWHFIPPSAPHFGGLWEAGVKSVKQHLRRVIGSDILNFEQFYTLLTQIESLLNSRPLCQISDNDLDALTPAHFILGESYSAVPEPSLEEIPQNRLSSWQALQSKVQGYWKRWSMEYLTSLQQRPRWTTTRKNLELNDLVVIKDSNIPPGKWSLGRVIEVHPGKDGHVRVVTLKTSTGSLVRPIHKLALLPIS